MTIAFTTENDYIIPNVAGETYMGGGGDDIYILSNAISDGESIVISDTEGINSIQLINGLSIASSSVYYDAVELTLSNGAIIQILSATSFTFDVGGNILTGEIGTEKTYDTFVTEDLGTTVPAEGEAPNEGGEVIIAEEGIPVVTAGQSFDLSETAVVDTAVGTVAATDVDGTVETFNIITGDTNNYFAIDDTGAITLTADGAANIDFETTPTYTLGVQVMDNEYNQSDIVDVTVNLTDVVEPELSISEGQTLDEGNTGTTAVQYTVTLNVAPGAGETVTVDYATADDTATTADADYTAASGTLTFVEGETTQTFDVNVTGDAVVEEDEAFTVTLSNATGSIDGADVSIVTADSTCTITNDDVAGEAYVLTTGMDDFTGGAGNDSFYAIIDEATAANTTFQSYDRLDGGDGTDTLDLSLVSDGATVAEYAADSTLDNIEIVSVKSSGATADLNPTFDADGLDGLQELISNKSSSDLIFDNIESLDTQITAYRINNVDSAGGVDGAEALQAIFVNSAASGTDDTVTVELERVTDANFDVDIRTDGTNGIENITVNSIGSDANTIQAIESEDSTAGNTELAKLAVTGDQDLTIGDALNFVNNIGTVDASAFTGDLDIQLTNAETYTVTGGSGDDTFTMGAHLGTTDSIDGGDGTDTVEVTGLAATTITLSTAYDLTSIENFQAEGGAGHAFTLATNGQTGLEKVILVENDTNSTDQTVNGLAAGVAVDLVGNDDGGNEAMGIVNLVLQDASGSSDELTVTLKGNATGSDGDGTDNDIEDIAFTNIETLNLVSSHLGTTALVAGDWNEILDISSDTTLTTINVSGSDRIKAVVGTEATNLATFDASAATGDNTFTLGAVSDVAVTTGSGDDTIIFGTTLNNADTVDGGDHGTGAADGDTLTATINGLTATTGALSISNVEKIH